MSAETRSIEARLTELSARVDGILDRLARLEERLGASLEPTPATPQREPKPAARLAEPAGVSPAQASLPVQPAAAATDVGDAADGSTPIRWVSLVGRTLLVLAGAYLIRAFRDAGSVPPLLPALAGLAYAALWMLAAARERGVRRPDSAVFHVIATALIAFPLIVEATLRFRIFTPALAAALVTAAAATALIVSGRLRILTVAWIVELAAVTSMLVIAFGSRSLLPAAAGLLLLAAVQEWLARDEWWLSLRWPPAIGLDLLMPFVIFLLALPDGPPEAWRPISLRGVTLLVVLLVVVYAAGIGLRTLGKRRAVGVFGIVQSIAAIAIALGAALALSGASSGAAKVIGVLCWLAAAGTYTAAFLVVDRRRGHSENFFFYSTVGGLLLLAGTMLALGSAWLAPVAGLLGLATALLGRRFDRFTLRCHAAVYGLVAAVASGWVADGIALLLGSTASAAPDQSLSAPTAALATIAAFFVLVTRTRAEAEPGWRLAPELLIALSASWFALIGLLGAGARLLPLLGLDSKPAVAALGTALVSVMTVLHEWRGAGGRAPELRLLAWLLLAAGAAKLATVDLRLGSPAASCVSLAFLGLALIVVSRLARRSG